MLIRFFIVGCVITVIGSIGCQRNSTTTKTLKIFPLDNMERVITQSGVSFDKAISSDGEGSLRIEVSKPTTVRLFEVRDISIEEARLIYKARLKTKDIQGQAYLEMWCSFPGLGEFFSRSLNSPLSGTVDWTTIETPFFLKKNQKPELIKLNVVINGQGILWIDDISLVKGPLQ
jgi:hypothetical protein